VPEPLRPALDKLRDLLLDDERLVRAVAAGKRRGEPAPPWRRTELRYVELSAGRRLQATTYDQTQAHTRNVELGSAAAEAVDAALAEPYGNWHVDLLDQTVQLRVTKQGDAQVHTAAKGAAAPSGTPEVPDRAHDRAKNHVLPPDDPFLQAVGIADASGRIKPSKTDKYRQIEEFLRLLGPVLDDALSSGRLPEPTPERPWNVIDLGCGNAYLTFAAYRYVTHHRGLPARFTGVDVKAQAHRRNTELAEQLGAADGLAFVQAAITDVEVDERPDVVLALHACDTATDDALARAVRWQAPVVLAAPCCHHDLHRQVRRGSGPPRPYALLTRSGILRERVADVLTDTLRAALLRMVGYRVDVVEFVDSVHTPRNLMVRAVRTGSGAPAEVVSDYQELTADWGVTPALERRLEPELAEVLHA
jgi:SAM-dependent methyltransferase